MNLNSHFKYQTQPLPADILAEKMAGNFDYARKLIALRLERPDIAECIKRRLELEIEILKDLEDNYTLTRSQLLQALQAEIPGFEDAEIDDLLLKGRLDFIYRNGERLFFDRTVPALIKVYPDIWTRTLTGDRANPAPLDDIINSVSDGQLFGAHYHMVQHLTVFPEDDVAGEIVRAYLPLPDEYCPRIKNFKLISCSHTPKHIASKDAGQKTVLFEERAETGKEFTIEYELDYVDRYRDVYNMDASKYSAPISLENKEKYLCEQLPHIRFTPFMRSLAEEFTEGCTYPLEKAKAIFDFITHNYRYRFVPHYGACLNVPETMAANQQGDCGYYAMLFITLCRICGIPAKWESGIWATPGDPGCHDWAMFYIEGLGWRHADLSFGGAANLRGAEKRRQFYFGNVEPYRVPFNSETCVDFEPEKKYWREDPCDNQKGDCEFESRNAKRSEFTSVLEDIDIHRIPDLSEFEEEQK